MLETCTHLFCRICQHSLLQLCILVGLERYSPANQACIVLERTTAYAMLLRTATCDSPGMRPVGVRFTLLTPPAGLPSVFSLNSPEHLVLLATVMVQELPELSFVPPFESETQVTYLKRLHKGSRCLWQMSFIPSTRAAIRIGGQNVAALPIAGVGRN